MSSIEQKHRMWLRDFYKRASEIITVCDSEFLIGLSETTKSGSSNEIRCTGRDVEGRKAATSWSDVKKIINGSFSSLGLKNNGTVLAVGECTGSSSEPSDLDVNGWSDIIDIAKAHYATIGLKKDGTVVAAGSNYYGECNARGFRSIKQIVAGDGFVAGLKSDGKVEFAGVDKRWQESHTNQPPTITHHISKIKHYYDTSSWTDIVRLYTLGKLTKPDTIVGLTRDGKVLVTGNSQEDYSELTSWTDIVDIIGDEVPFGIRRDGSVVFCSRQKQLLSDIGFTANFEHIVSIDEGYNNALLILKNDGTVTATGFTSEQIETVKTWKNIVALYPMHKMILGLKANGEVLQTSYAPIETLNNEKQLDDLYKGIHRDLSVYMESYTINTKPWRLIRMDFDAYILAVRMMLEDDAVTPRGLLQTIDYFANAKELIICLSRIDDKRRLYKCIVHGARLLHDQYGLNDVQKFNINNSDYENICRLLQTTSESTEMQEYLNFLHDERAQIRSKYEDEKKSKASECWQEMLTIDAERKKLEKELAKLPAFAILKKKELNRRIKELVLEYVLLEQERRKYL